jgi:hypothetical protein
VDAILGDLSKITRVSQLLGGGEGSLGGWALVFPLRDDEPNPLKSLLTQEQASLEPKAALEQDTAGPKCLSGCAEAASSTAHFSGTLPERVCIYKLLRVK